MLDRNSASVPTSAKSCWHAVMIALRESFGLRWESMKSTFTLRPAIPPVALMYLAAPFTASTADWNRPGANGLSTSATTAMRISVGVTPTSVALLASLCAPALTVPTVASPAEMTSAHAQNATLSRFTGPPLEFGPGVSGCQQGDLSHPDPMPSATAVALPRTVSVCPASVRGHEQGGQGDARERGRRAEGPHQGPVREGADAA